MRFCVKSDVHHLVSTAPAFLITTLCNNSTTRLAIELDLTQSNHMGHPETLASLSPFSPHQLKGIAGSLAVKLYTALTRQQKQKTS